MLDIIKRGFIEQFPTRQSTMQHARLLEQMARSSKPSILVAAMPKSASTFLSNVLAKVSGYPKTHFVYGWERNAQDLYLPQLVRCMGIPTVVQQHTVATGPNLELIRIFNLRTIVLVRNIFDVVVSILDHSVSEDFRGPAGYLTEDYLTLDQPTKIDMIIDGIVPWYLGFFVSWCEAQQRSECQTHWITYKELIEDEAATVREALAYCGMEASQQAVQAAVDALKAAPGSIRFNKGVGGRGEHTLTVAQKQRIIRLTRYYPSIDFSLIGLPGVSHDAARQIAG